jgi:hypothetical protein
LFKIKDREIKVTKEGLLELVPEAIKEVEEPKEDKTEKKD